LDVEQSGGKKIEERGKEGIICWKKSFVKEEARGQPYLEHCGKRNGRFEGRNLRPSRRGSYTEAGLGEKKGDAQESTLLEKAGCLTESRGIVKGEESYLGGRRIGFMHGFTKPASSRKVVKGSVAFL